MVVKNLKQILSFLFVYLLDQVLSNVFNSIKQVAYIHILLILFPYAPRILTMELAAAVFIPR